MSPTVSHDTPPRRRRRRLDLSGRTFGSQTVVARAEGEHGRSFWRCQCACGSPERIVRASCLISGKSLSCGGCERGNLPEKHGLSGTPEYLIWKAMIDRCHNPKNKRYSSYGGRGIRVCDRWRRSFTAFLSDMKARPADKRSIDRFPNQDGHYEPNNCRWANDKEQARNQHSNHLVQYQGRTLCVAELTELYARADLSPTAVAGRLDRGWSVDRALSTPPKMLAKLTKAQAQEIFDRVARGELQYKLAAEFGVSTGNISAIVLGKAWPTINRTARATEATPPRPRVIIRRIGDLQPVAL